MDNKQDRQFYWEVKQFLNNDAAASQPVVKKPSVKDAISSVVNENNVFKQSNFIKNTESQKVVPSYLSDLSKAEKGYKPECKAYTSNKTVNPFNLHEQKGMNQDEDMTTSPRDSVYNRGGSMMAGRPPAYQGDGGGKPLMTGRELENQEKMERMNAQAQERMAASRSRREQLAAQRRQDKVASLTKELEGAGISIPETPEGEEADYDKMMTAIGSEGRRAVERGRRQRNLADAEKYQADVERRLGGKDIADMTEKEAAEWAFAHSRVNTSLKSTSSDREGDSSSSRERVDGQIKSNTEKMEQGFARLGTFEDVRKREAAEAALDKPISPFYKISRREFKNTFGRDYDASGGANTANMRALQNWKTDLPGRLTRGEEEWQGKMAHKAEMDFLEKNKDLLKAGLRGDAAAAEKIKAGVNFERAKAKKANPVFDYTQTDFDVPPGPGQGSFGGPQKVSPGRTITTSPIKRPLSKQDQTILNANKRGSSLTEEINSILEKKKIDEDFASSFNQGFGSVVKTGANLLSGLFDNKVTRTLKGEADAALRATGIKKTEEEEEKEELADRTERDAKIEQDSKLSQNTKNFVDNMRASVDKTLASADKTLKDTAPKPVQGVDASDEATQKAQSFAGTMNASQVLSKVGDIVGGNMGSMLNAAGTGIYRGASDAKYGPSTPPAEQTQTTAGTATSAAASTSAPAAPAPNAAPVPVANKAPSPTTTPAPAGNAAPAPTTTPAPAGNAAPSPTQSQTTTTPVPGRKGKTPEPNKPAYKPGMTTNAQNQQRQRAQAEEQRRMRNRQPGRGNNMMQQGIAMASRYGVNPMSQLGGAGNIVPSNVNLSMGSLGSMQNQNLSGFKMSRGLL